jgi:hypothetical protein
MGIGRIRNLRCTESSLGAGFSYCLGKYIRYYYQVTHFWVINSGFHSMHQLESPQPQHPITSNIRQKSIESVMFLRTMKTPDRCWLFLSTSKNILIDVHKQSTICKDINLINEENTLTLQEKRCKYILIHNTHSDLSVLFE